MEHSPSTNPLFPKTHLHMMPPDLQLSLVHHPKSLGFAITQLCKTRASPFPLSIHWGHALEIL
jgi:hypothetical protein